jgi:hypothetical protein
MPEKTFTREEYLAEIKRRDKEQPGFLAKTAEVLGGIIADPAFQGGVAGGLAGAAMGGPISAIVGTGLGAAASVAGVEGAKSVMGRSDKTPLEIGKEAAVRGAWEAGSEATGQLPVKGIQWLFKARTISPKIRALEQEFEKHGGQLTSAQQTPESAAGGMMTGLAKASIPSRILVISPFEETQKGALRDYRQSVADQLARYSLQELPAEARGAIVKDTLLGGKKVHHDMASELYATLDDEVAGPKVSMAPVVQRAEKILEMLNKLKGVGKVESGGSTLEKLASFKRVNEQTGVTTYDDLSFMESHMLRSNLLAELRSLEASTKGARARKYIRETTDLLDQQMEQAAKDIGPDALRAWRRADEFYRTGKKTFDNQFVAHLMSDKKTADAVGNLLSEAGSVEEIRKVKTALGYAKRLSTIRGAGLDVDKAWEALSQGWFRGIVNKYTVGDELKATGLLKEFSKQDTQEAFKAIFTPDQQKTIKQFVETAELTQRKLPAEGYGTVAVQLTQAGVAISAISAARLPTAGELGIVFIAPWAFAKMLTHPKFGKMLAVGSKMPANSPLASGLAARLISEAARLEPPDGETRPAVSKKPNLSPASQLRVPPQRPQLTQGR